MKLIHKGRIVFVDKDVASWWAWDDLYYNKTGYLVYKVGHKHYSVHQLIMGKAPKGFCIDHINRNKLDNRRKNLRFVTYSENSINSDRVEKARLRKIHG